MIVKANKSSVTENYLILYGLVGVAHNSKAAKLLMKVQPRLDSFDYISPSKYFKVVWEEMSNHKLYSSSSGGEAFELLFACILLREGIGPFYMQAEMAYVPDSHFDFIVYTKEIGPFALSLKTSLRERYKQAELESISLRNVHRLSRSFLLTLNRAEAIKLQNKVISGELIAIEQVVLADSVQLDRLIAQLKKYTPIKAPKVDVVTKGIFIKS